MERKRGQRTVKSIQRYGEDMPETTVTLDPHTRLVSAGITVPQQKEQDLERAIREALGHGPLTEEEIRKKVGGDNTRTAEALRKMVNSGKVSKDGEGKKGSPFKYSLPASPLGDSENRESATAPKRRIPRWQRLVMIEGVLLGYSESEAITAEEVLEKMPHGRPPSLKALRKDLNDGVKEVRWRVTGKNGSPRRYYTDDNIFRRGRRAASGNGKISGNNRQQAGAIEADVAMT